MTKLLLSCWRNLSEVPIFRSCSPPIIVYRQVKINHFKYMTRHIDSLVLN